MLFVTLQSQNDYLFIKIHLISSFAPGAAFLMHARISRSLARDSFAEAEMYEETVRGLGMEIYINK